MKRFTNGRNYIEKPTMQNVIYKLENHQKELAFGFCLFVLIHMPCVKELCSMMRNGQDVG
jgi:hypothetical protein